jgi:anthranilate synthase/phosphoribosyltransferase
MHILIDNYDSFTYNVYQYLAEITDDPIKVVRNDEITLQELIQINPQTLIISPGPGRPEDAGVSVEAIQHFAGKVPILGICLGHQAIGYALGGNIVGAKEIVHGKAQAISLDGKGLYRGLANPSTFTRYHSLVIDHGTLPDELEITSYSADGEIMGVRHKEYIMEGVQFHPESIASSEGKQLLKNFLNYRREPFAFGPLLKKVLEEKGGLSFDEAASFMEEVTEGTLAPAKMASFLTALNAKGIVAEEIAGCASVLQKKRVPVRAQGEFLDTCGTGGDGHHTFNISSMTGLLAASMGVRVAKHGNRAVTSKSGSSEFYSQLGLEIQLSPQNAAKLLDQTGFAFLFAPVYHKAMRFAAPVRKELGIKTIFNLLGPLVNPAKAAYQLIGVYHEDLPPIMARAAHMLGVKRVMVVHGMDGLDELSISAPTRVIEMDEAGVMTDYVFRPDSVGLKGYKLEDLAGGDAEENAKLGWDLLKGKGRPAIIESVALNTGAALVVAGRARSIKEGYGMAKEALAKPETLEFVEQVISASQNLDS